jgi:hypothetical protein
MARAGGPTKTMPGVGTGLGKRLALGQEAVAGVDGLRAGAAGHVEQLLDDEIALAGRRRADVVRLVGEAHVGRVAVGVGVDGHGGDAQFARRAQDAHGDLAAVGNQQFIKFLN